MKTPHYTNVNEQHGISCSICKKKFPDLEQLIKHLKTDKCKPKYTTTSQNSPDKLK